MICYYNGNILRTEIDVKYVGNKALIVPLDVRIDCTCEQLGDMIYSRTVTPLFRSNPIGGSKPDSGCYVTNYSKLRTLSFFHFYIMLNI